MEQGAVPQKHVGIYKMSVIGINSWWLCTVDFPAKSIRQNYVINEPKIC